MIDLIFKLTTWFKCIPIAYRHDLKFETGRIRSFSALFINDVEKSFFLNYMFISSSNCFLFSLRIFDIFTSSIDEAISVEALVIPCDYAALSTLWVR